VAIVNNRVFDNDAGLNATGVGTFISGNTFGLDLAGTPLANRYDNIDLDAGSHTVTGNRIVGGDYGVWLFSYAGVTAGATATITRNTISGTLAGVLATDSAADAFRAAATITENFITGNAAGIAVSDATGGGAGISLVTARCNDLSANTAGVNTTGAFVEAEENWWGSATGPANTTNPGGTGAGVADSVDYAPG
jgi:hypothetical protein